MNSLIFASTRRGAGKTSLLVGLARTLDGPFGYLKPLGDQLLYRKKRPWDADDLIEAVGLGGQAGKKISALSGGQRRRMDVAIGVVGRPELLFLDEPTAGFDPQARREFHDLVHRLSDLEDTTILLTTHDLDEAEKLADRILILAGGEIIADGSANQLSRRMSMNAEVKWSQDGQQFVHSDADSTRFVRELFEQYGGDISDLEVRRANLEDSYMALVQRFETGQEGRAVREFEEVGR